MEHKSATKFEEGSAMLVLSRHKDETIMIGDDIELTVVDIRGDKVVREAYLGTEH